MKSELKSAWALMLLCISQLFYTANAYAASPYAPGKALGQEFNSAGQAWWDAISIGGLWVTGIALAICWGFGLTQYWRWAAGGFLIFVLGDVAVDFFMTMSADNNPQ
jgi:hypothetical protein